MGFVDKVLTDLRKRGVWLDPEQAKVLLKHVAISTRYTYGNLPVDEQEVLARFAKRCQEFE